MGRAPESLPGRLGPLLTQMASQVSLAGGCGGFSPRPHAEFGQDVGHVELHCVLGDVQPCGDLLVAPAPGQLCQHVEFAGREVIYGELDRGGAAVP